MEMKLLKQNDRIFLSDKESGIGVTAEEYKKILERFYRATASKVFAKGSGLGLSIAKKLLESHDGSLYVDSEQGKRKKLIISLPIEK